MLDKVTPGKFPADALVDRLGLPQAQIIAEINRLFSGFDDAALIALRDLVEDEMGERAAERRRQLAAIETARGAPPARNPGSALRGTKVPPKYRGPNGETWAGRGAYPNWLAILIGQGRSRDEFLIRSEGR